MGLLKTGISAIGKLFIVVALAGTFIVGMVSVVYMSLRGEEIVIPELVGKNLIDGEKELESLGLKLRKVRSIYSKEKPNTILEQRPRAGEIGKTGLMISVYVAEANPDGQETPATIIKDEDDEIETTPDLEIPSDKKKANKNSNVKRATTTRDVEKTNKNSNSDSSSNNSASNTGTTGTKTNTSTPVNPANKTVQPTPANKTIVIPSSSPKPVTTPKPAPAKTPVTGGDMRNRRVN